MNNQKNSKASVNSTNGDQKQRRAIHVTHPAVLTFASQDAACRPRQCSQFRVDRLVRHRTNVCQTKPSKPDENQRFSCHTAGFKNHLDGGVK